MAPAIPFPAHSIRCNPVGLTRLPQPRGVMIASGMVIALEHIEWATERGFSLADIAESVGMPIGADPGLASTAIVLATAWIHLFDAMPARRHAA